MNYLSLSFWQLALSALFILVNITFSFLLKLRMEKQLAIAAARMASQLLFVGYILKWIFALQNALWILFIACFMAGIASFSAVNRTRRKFSGMFWNSLVSILTSSFVITIIAMQGIIQPIPWYHPQYVIPILGMVLGNSLNGVSLSLDRFLEDVVLRQDQIESLLAFGATRWEAAHESIKEGIRTGMTPIVNSMMVMGIVSLPGMMTGQILAGAKPLDAVYYQIVIVFIIASCVAFSVVGVVLSAYFMLFNQRHQFCFDRITIPKSVSK